MPSSSPSKTKKTQASHATKHKASSPAPALDYDQARQAAENAARHFIKAKKTNEKYSNYVKAGSAFVKSLSDDDALKAKIWSQHSKTAQSQAPEHEIDDGELKEDELDPGEDVHSPDPQMDRVMDPEFGEAFDGPPKPCTPEAIAIFLWYKCFHEGRKVSTANLIYSAFVNHYKMLDGDKFRGPWQDDGISTPRGNPAHAARVQDMLKAIKKKDGEPERKHSRAMSYDDMRQVYEYISKECPAQEEVPSHDQQSKAKRGRLLYYLAVSSFAWTVWTRNCETRLLQFKHFDFNPAAKICSDGKQHSYWVVNLRNRKNWQAHLEKGEHQLYGHVYNIYSKPEDPAIDVYQHVLRWKDFLEDHILGRPMEDNDYMFPGLGANLTINPGEPSTYAFNRDLIKEVATAAGLHKANKYMTHCFRRGGAQYRFMFASIGRRWTMARIRWWGGWATGERGDTLIRYLLDELQTYEEDHRDALCPSDETANRSHMGEDRALRPLTTSDGQEFFNNCKTELNECLKAQIEGLSQHVSWLTNSCFTAMQVVRHQQAPPLQPQHSASTYQALLPSNSSLQPFTSHIGVYQQPNNAPFQLSTVNPSGICYSPQRAASTMPLCHTRYQPGPSLPPHQALYQPPPSLPYQALYQPLPQPSIRHCFPQEIPTAASFEQHPPAPSPAIPFQPSSMVNSSIQQRRSASHPRYMVPHIKRSKKAWLQVVQDWTTAQPGRCPVPLRDWDPSWWKETNQGMLYHIRKVIAEEFLIQYREDTDSFCRAYPDHDRGVKPLYDAIIAVHQRCGKAGVRAKRSTRGVQENGSDWVF